MTMPPPPGGQPDNPKAAAAAAKAYAKAERPWYKKKRVIIPAALVTLVVIASAAGAGGDTDDDKDETTSSSSSNNSASGDNAEPTKAAKEEPKEEPKPAPADVKVDASSILKEFEQNEFAADEKYKGKTLEVTGRVNKIDTDMFDSDKYILRIGGGGDFEFLTVNCEGVSKDQLAKLDTGQKVTVVGEFDDGGDLGVEMQDCDVK